MQNENIGKYIRNGVFVLSLRKTIGKHRAKHIPGTNTLTKLTSEISNLGYGYCSAT